mgnify:CR=1 FL=1
MSDTICKKCGAKIRFIKTKKNDKWHPIDIPGFDVAPGQDVGSVMQESGEMRNTTFTPFTEKTFVYNSHMGTCPEGPRKKKD